MGIVVAVAIVTFLVLSTVVFIFSRRAFARIEHVKVDILSVSVFATLNSIDIAKKGKSSALFTNADGEDVVLTISKLDSAFLCIGEKGLLKFKGDKFVSFKPSDEVMEEES